MAARLDALADPPVLMVRTPAEAAASFAAAMSEAAQALYAADSSTDTLFVRSQAEAGNAAAAAVVALLEDAWDRYGRAKAVVEQLDSALKRRDTAEADRLAGPAAVQFEDGSEASLDDAIASVRREVSEVSAHVTRLAEAARTTLVQLAAFDAEVRSLSARAAAVDAERDPEIRGLPELLEQASTECAVDPTASTALDALAARLVAARDRVETLEDERSELPSRLQAAAAELDEIEALVRQGADAYLRVHDRIAEPTGLLEPLRLDPDDERSLRRWLHRISDEADAGRWAVASKGLAAWRTVADQWLHTAGQVALANGRALDRRNELRGLLDAYRAKAAAQGRAEDPELARLGTAAQQILFGAPCDLAKAEDLVRRYVTALNGGERS